MKINLLFAGLLIVTLLAACAAPAPEPSPIPTQKLSNCAEVDDPCIVITFTEDKCIYEGPNRVPPGKVYFQFVNQRDERSRMGFWRFREDRSLEEYQANIGNQPSTAHHTINTFEAFEPAKIAGPGKGFFLVKEVSSGEYLLDCFTEEPYLLWFGGGLVVE
jgi:hypothetical protein